MNTLHDVLTSVVNRFGDRVAFDSPDGQLTFRQFGSHVNHLAGALSSLGIKKGDRVAILATNCVDYIAYHYATASLGAILLVLNVRHTEVELQWAINDAEPSALIIGTDFQAMLGNLQAACVSVEYTIAIGEKGTADYSTSNLYEMQKPFTPPAELSELDPALLIYTSGTSGRPKGTLQTHQGSIVIDQLTANSLEIQENDVYLAFMPYFHQAGLIRTRATLLNGGVNLVRGKVDPETLIACILEQNVSITMLPPPYDELLIKIANERQLAFPSLRFIIGGGGMGVRHAERMRLFCERFACRYMGVYGQTEVTGPATVITDDDYFSRPESCGKPMAGIGLEIWDENKNPVPTGSIGEIVISGKTCIPRYWRNDEANRELYSGAWLHTGDMGRLDAEGFLFLKGRIKELIKTGGENVYPKEVEDVLFQHDAIEDVAVIGLPDPGQWGEKVAAVVVLKPGESLSANEVKDFCGRKIANYKIPKSLKCVDSLPRNHSGKVLKRVLQEQFNLS